jgi:hypothetical protein
MSNLTHKVPKRPLNARDTGAILSQMLDGKNARDTGAILSQMLDGKNARETVAILSHTVGRLERQRDGGDTVAYCWTVTAVA